MKSIWTVGYVIRDNVAMPRFPTPHNPAPLEPRHHAPDAVSDREPRAPVLDTFEAACWG